MSINTSWHVSPWVPSNPPGDLPDLPCKTVKDKSRRSLPDVKDETPPVMGFRSLKENPLVKECVFDYQGNGEFVISLCSLAELWEDLDTEYPIVDRDNCYLRLTPSGWDIMEEVSDTTEYVSKEKKYEMYLKLKKDLGL